MPSNRPGAASETCGTRNHTDATTRAASAAATQKSVCQSQFWATNADSGSPIAPPTPSVALIAAIAVPVRCGGVISRISEMPTGMNPIASPCIARPTSIGASESLSAQTMLATSSSPALATSTRCLPKRSASRPATGIATAAASSVIVMTHAALAWLLPRSSPQLALDRDQQRLGQRRGQAAEAQHDHRQHRVLPQEPGRDQGRFVGHTCIVHVVAD